MSIANLVPLGYSGQRVLTNVQLAQVYECEASKIRNNFSVHKEYFEPGRDYFKLEGQALKNLKSDLGAKIFSPGFPIRETAPVIFLWTRQGALIHCKMLGSEKAKKMFKFLEENYFDGKGSSETFDLPEENYFGGKKTSPSIQGVSLSQMVTEIGEYYKFDLTSLKKIIPLESHEFGTLFREGFK